MRIVSEHVKSNLRRTVCIDLKAKKNIKPSPLLGRKTSAPWSKTPVCWTYEKRAPWEQTTILKKQDKRTLDRLSAPWHTRKPHLDIQDKIYDIQDKQTLDKDKVHIGHKRKAHFGQANVRHTRQKHWFYNVAIQKQTNNISITFMFNGR